MQWKGLRLNDQDDDERRVPTVRFGSYEVELFETPHRPPRVRVVDAAAAAAAARDDDDDDVASCAVTFHDRIVPECRYTARVRWRAAPPLHDEVGEWVSCVQEATVPTAPRLQMHLPVQTFARAVSLGREGGVGVGGGGGNILNEMGRGRIRVFHGAVHIASCVSVLFSLSSSEGRNELNSQPKKTFCLTTEMR